MFGEMEMLIILILLLHIVYLFQIVLYLTNMCQLKR
jgi:hypothetical protein